MAAALTGTPRLNVAMTLVGHEQCFYDDTNSDDGRRMEKPSIPTISYFPDGQRIITGSPDKTTRVWDLRAGKEIEEARVTYEQEVRVVLVSRDSRWVIAATDGKSLHKPGEFKANNVEKGITKTFDGHSKAILCADISVDNKLLASGSLDGTTRIWSLDTGKLAAGPFKHGGEGSDVGVVVAVQFSRDSRNFAVKSLPNLEVWDIEAQKLVKARKEASPRGHNMPVLWTTNKSIVGAFSILGTIYEFDSSTLKTIGAPFEGHRHYAHCLALSSNCTLLVSASFDMTLKLWAFESR